MADKIRDTAEAVKGIVEAVPVYTDAIQPTAQVIGEGLETLTKAALLPLIPFRLLVHGFEQMEHYLLDAMDKRLKRIPEERQIPPNPAVAGPALDALRFVVEEPDLRELYANLLATSMDSEIAKNAHPAFVEIIKQMSPDEARIIQVLASTGVSPMVSVGTQYFRGLSEEFNHLDVEFLKNFSLLQYEANCSHPELFPSYLDNLNRLGLVQIKENYYLAGKNVYEHLENHPRIIESLSELEPEPDSIRQVPALRREALFLTNLGQQFCATCVTKSELS
jgi:hypothetical protein